MHIPYSLIYSTHNGDDAPQNSDMYVPTKNDLDQFELSSDGMPHVNIAQSILWLDYGLGV
jgi:hypothetical protein